MRYPELASETALGCQSTGYKGNIDDQTNEQNGVALHCTILYNTVDIRVVNLCLYDEYPVYMNERNVHAKKTENVINK